MIMFLMLNLTMAFQEILIFLNTLKKGLFLHHKKTKIFFKKPVLMVVQYHGQMVPTLPRKPYTKR